MKQVEEQVKQCQVCAKEALCSKEPMIALLQPDYPWLKVGSDLFVSGGSTLMLVVDYFSRIVEISKLTTTSSSFVTIVLKSIFARYGIPEIMISDNGPQYEMKQFARQYGFKPHN